MVTEIVGYLAGLLLSLSFLPQVIKTFRSKQAHDVSMGMLILTLSCGLLYEVYAWRLGLRPVIIMNGFFTILVAMEIALKIRYDREVEKTPSIEAP